MMVLSFIYLCIITFSISVKCILGYKCNVLIIQMHFAHSHYAKVGKIEGEKLRQRIETKRQTTSETSSSTSNH